MNGKMILVLAICLAGIVLLSVLAAVLISRFLKKRQKKNVSFSWIIILPHHIREQTVCLTV